MNRTCIVILALAFVLVSCASSPSNSTSIAAVDGRQATPDTNESFVDFQVEDIQISVPRPDGWESFTTDPGIVIAETISSVADEGELDGLVMHVYVPVLEDLPLPAVDGDNIAQQILQQIVEDPNYTGSASINGPFAFDWNDYDSAYYLFNNGDVSIVIGVALPGTTRIIACSVSAPVAEADRIRAMLPRLLNGVRINGIELDGGVLEDLPNPLVFPVFPEG